MFGHRTTTTRENRDAMMKPMQAPPEPPGVHVGWRPSADTGQELGELEALESLQIARRTFARATEASRDCERLLVDATDALTEAKARVRRMAERP